MSVKVLPVDVVQTPRASPAAAKPKKWSVRRTLSVVLIASGLCWLVIGFMIYRLLF
jgi:hypothetical protein